MTCTVSVTFAPDCAADVSACLRYRMAIARSLEASMQTPPGAADQALSAFAPRLFKPPETQFHAFRRQVRLRVGSTGPEVISDEPPRMQIPWGLTAPVGRIAEWRKQQGHMIMRSLGHAEADRNHVQKARALRGRADGIEIVARMEDQLVFPCLERVCRQDLLIGAPVIVRDQGFQQAAFIVQPV